VSPSKDGQGTVDVSRSDKEPGYLSLQLIVGDNPDEYHFCCFLLLIILEPGRESHNYRLPLDLHIPCKLTHLAYLSKWR
jgi:hypothetical protein